jgi:hypothetical protein
MTDGDTYRPAALFGGGGRTRPPRRHPPTRSLIGGTRAVRNQHTTDLGLFLQIYHTIHRLIPALSALSRLSACSDLWTSQRPPTPDAAMTASSRRPGHGRRPPSKIWGIAEVQFMRARGGDAAWALTQPSCVGRPSAPPCRGGPSGCLDTGSGGSSVETLPGQAAARQTHTAAWPGGQSGARSRTERVASQGV